jgi:hypothetical protein
MGDEFVDGLGAIVNRRTDTHALAGVAGSAGTMRKGGHPNHVCLLFG